MRIFQQLLKCYRIRLKHTTLLCFYGSIAPPVYALRNPNSNHPLAVVHGFGLRAVGDG